MALKFLSVLFFGLAFCCFLQSTAAQQETCQLKFWFSSSVPGSQAYRSGEGSFVAPFKGWYLSATYSFNLTSSLISLKLVEPAASCGRCALTVFSTNNFTGESELYDFRERAGDFSQIEFGFSATSYTLECFPEEEETLYALYSEGEKVYGEEAEEEEEEETYYGYEEAIEVPEEEEEEEDISDEFLDAEYQEMNEDEGLTLPSEVIQLRERSVRKAVSRLEAKGLLPHGQYTISKIYPTEFSTNYNTLYRFNVQVSNQYRVGFRIFTIAFHDSEENQYYSLIDCGLIENRIGEFTHTEFREIHQDEDSPLLAEIITLRSRAVNQAVDRMKAKDILPHGQYELDKAFATEFSHIFDHPEFPHHDDILYRFTVQVINKSRVQFRVFVIVATNYETPQDYQLIDYSFKENRIDDFPGTQWTEYDEHEQQLPFEVSELMVRAVDEAAHRLQAKGILPQGKLSASDYFRIESSDLVDHPEYSNSSNVTLYRFTAQVRNESGTTFRVIAVALMSHQTPQKYELIYYVYEEMRYDGMHHTDWVQVYEDREYSLDPILIETREKSVNQAVNRLKAKGILRESQYTIAKTFITKYAIIIENPDYPPGRGETLYRFNVQLRDESGAKYRVFTIVVNNLQSSEFYYELIDYGVNENIMDEFTRINFQETNPDELRNKSLVEAIDSLEAKGILAQGQYTIGKTYPTEFSSRFDHPEFSPANQDILYRFNAEVNNATGAGFRVSAVIVTNFETPLDYELIDSRYFQA